jgi:hypothetical protein
MFYSTTPLFYQQGALLGCAVITEIQAAAHPATVLYQERLHISLQNWHNVIGQKLQAKSNKKARNLDVPS